MLILRLGVLLVLWTASGCVRASWETMTPSDGARDDRLVPDGSPSPVDGLAHREGAPLPPAKVTAANDDCSNPAVIDLGPLAGGGQVSFTVNTTGAQQDYTPTAAPAICGTNPDVVVQLSNAPAGIWWSCAGPGSVTVAYTSVSFPHPCPSSFNSTTGISCNAGWMSMGLLASTSYMMICRNPAEGPATITMQQK